MDRRAAIIVSLPGYFDPWSSSFDYDSEFEGIVRDYVVQAARPVEDTDAIRSAVATFYHVGPMAQSHPMWMITMLRDAVSLLSDIGGLITLAQLARVAVRAIRQWSDDARRRLPPNPNEMYATYHDQRFIMLSEPLVVGLCVEHFAANYRWSGRAIKIDRAFRSAFPGFSSAEHPGGDGHYAVRIWTGRASYLYLVNCYGEPVEHLLFRGQDMEQLVLPSCLDEAPSREDDGVAGVRSTVARV